MRNTFIMLIAVALVALLPVAGQAALVVGDAAGDVLSIVNPDTGTLTEVASVGTPHIVSLAYCALTGKTYCSDTSEGVNQVLEIDPETGATSLVVQVQDFYTTLHALAVHPSTGELYAIDNSHAALYRIDIEAGQLVYVGNLGVFWISGADFDPETGVLYGCVGGMDSTGALYTIDVETAATTFVASTERLMGLAFDIDGQLYGVDNYWYPDEPGIYRINKTTGTAEVIGLYPGTNLMSIDWMPVGTVAVEPMSLSDVKSLFN
jgi:DNA-binding beta-propeller fold protein YncE